jgi:hypothetical protein
MAKRRISRQKGAKYNNTKVEFDGLKFDSKKEMLRYMALKDAESKGIISDLQTQVKYELIPAVTEEYVEHLKTKDRIKTRTVQLAITYKCDFAYIKDNQLVIEDVKASPKMLPKEYILKKKMLFALKGLRIKEIYKPNEII